MQPTDITELYRLAEAFRGAIERARAEQTGPYLPYFPDGACKLVARLFAMHLRSRGEYSMQIVSGHVPRFESYVRHTWLVVDGTVVDITADPFGEAPVIVGPRTHFHESLGAQEQVDAAEAIAAFSSEESLLYRRLLGPIEQHVASALS
jgi:hypothetical protein